jgi:tRNA (mo5U34)-methyltransferase
MDALSIAELHQEAKNIGWFHSIDLGDGHWTNGHKKPERMEAELASWKFPANLTGKTVLDIGCADGGYSVAAIRRGARSVLSIDQQLTSGMRFLLKNKLFHLEYRRMDLFSGEFMDLPTFDIIIFAGVLYHTQDPLDALKRIRSKARELVILETHINESFGTNVPYMIYYETIECNGDQTNWWGPNTPCLEAMFRTVGFNIKKVFQEAENESNGRVCYHLQPGEGSVYTKVIGMITDPLTAFDGCIDIMTGSLIAGWAWDADHPDNHVIVEILVDGQLLAQVPAREYREDLKRAVIGDGSHAFRYNFPSDVDPNCVSAIIAGTGVCLRKGGRNG